MPTDSVTGNDDLNKEIIQWSYKFLLSNGYTLKNKVPENVQNTPWSYIVYFKTSDGYIYLKHTPELLSLEASIIQILHQFHVSVPEVIAHNAELKCYPLLRRSLTVAARRFPWLVCSGWFNWRLLMEYGVLMQEQSSE